MLGQHGRHTRAIGEELFHHLAHRVLRQVAILSLRLLGGCVGNVRDEVVVVRLSIADANTRVECESKARILRVRSTLPHVFVLLVHGGATDCQATIFGRLRRAAGRGSVHVFAIIVDDDVSLDDVLRHGR